MKLDLQEENHRQTPFYTIDFLSKISRKARGSKKSPIFRFHIPFDLPLLSDVLIYASGFAI
ncbi:hypothetical protein IQ235_15995 [Oscillatoriales cyanobacterium LEGE 11467]|uniref:Uncharacterized protein n=1 Tax=Zarconia navalis LEGE 11467 TaxID=1828826 RepID=A0A928ZB43_9CYAN|nr:hypothetical protein [Zarconia navalis LEGE 11467]